MSEIAEHNNTEKGYWFVIRGEVYDVTRYHREHPGSSKVLLKLAGIDATKVFDKVHGRDHYLMSMSNDTVIELLKQ